MPMSALRITHIASGDLWAGAEAQMANLLAALHQTEGVKLDVVLLNHGELEARLRQAGIPVTVLDEGQLSAFIIAWRLWRHFRRKRPDLVHTHRCKENVLGSVAARLVGARSVRTVHGRDEDDSPRWRLDKRSYRWLDRFSGRWLQQRLIAVSAQLREELAVDFSRQRITVIENGIDVDALVRAAKPRASLPGQAGRIRIGLVGRLAPVKRVDLFLQVAHDLQARQPGMFEFYVVGEGAQDVFCRQLIERLGLNDVVHLLGFHANAAAILAALDLLLMTSDHEGLPMTLLEALGLEIPIVAGAVGGIPELLADGAAGTLVHQQQPGAYVEAVLALFADPASLQRKVRSGVARVRGHYSAERNADEHVALYREIVSISGVAARAGNSSTETTGV